MNNKDLKRRIIDISYKKGLSHISSALTAVDIIDRIFIVKKPQEKFILSSGHAGLALYVVLEKYEKKDAEVIFDHHGVHPDRCADCGIDCSAGSLGQGLPIAVGIALANPNNKVHCLISDGECAEGSIWESLNIIDKYRITNLELYVNINGWGAYDAIDTHKLVQKLRLFYPNIHIIYTNVDDFPLLQGQQGHYHKLSAEDYKLLIKAL